MNNETLRMIQEQIGYSFQNTDLLQQAFIRRSFSKENGGEDNEILEFIGDKALDFVIVRRLMDYYGSFVEEYDDYNPNEDWNEFTCEYNEGKLTNIKKKLVCREMLAKKIRTMGLQYFLIMGKSDINQGVMDKDSVQEDLFEAIIGAVALDSNWDFEKLINVVDLMLEPDYYLENGFNDENNYVELLQQWYQKKHNKIPVYTFRKNNLIGFYGNSSNYICDLGLFPLEIGFTGYGNTKNEARMEAAQKAYAYLVDNNLLFTLIDEIGEPEFNRAINQLQELYQKGYIEEPWYNFIEKYDSDGNPVWRCECHITDKEDFWYGDYPSKKQGKKAVAYDMLCEILEREAVQ